MENRRDCAVLGFNHQKGMPENNEVPLTSILYSENFQTSFTEETLTSAYKERVGKYHPDRKGGSAEKVSIMLLSSKKFHKHMKLYQTLKKEKSMINMEQKVLSPMAAI